MAALIFKKIPCTKLLAIENLLRARFMNHFKCGYKSLLFARRELKSSSVVSNLKNLASEAEKVVGYQTSLLRCLLSDEISSVLVHSKKLAGSRHPLLKTARRMIYDGAEGFNAVGLIVLLMSRSGEGLMTAEGPPLGQEPVSGIQRKQRKLAEVAEMINTGYMVHLGMVNKSNFQSSDDPKIMNFGNKITVLTGDFLLAKASVGLSELENAEVVHVMASVIGDIVEGETLKDYKTLNETSWTDWEEVIFKSWGSLFAKSCLAALKLCSLTKHHQQLGYTFGKNLALLQKLSRDHLELKSDLKTISLNNAAVIQNKHLLPCSALDNPLSTLIPVPESTRLKLQKFETVQNMNDFAKGYGNKALASLESFPTSEAKSCLENLVKHLMALQTK